MIELRSMGRKAWPFHCAQNYLCRVSLSCLPTVATTKQFGHELADALRLFSPLQGTKK